MPLPVNGTPWPPKPLEGITPALSLWDAWYTGDPTALEKAYQGNAAPRVRPSQLAGGVVGTVARFFWGRPNLDATQPKHKLHVPIAADLCQASADLLFAESPTFTVDDKAAQDRLDELVGDRMLGSLAEAAEVGAALGGSYLRVTWDPDIVPDGPFLTAVHADAAWPEFRWGRLVAVTFWRVVESGNQRVLRHLERHELDPVGNGVILHGLFEGTWESLGNAVPLTEHAATSGIVVNEDSLIDTLTPGLAVGYVPNIKPQRGWRNHPVGANLGRSDLDGIEGLMDSLDETYTSWMRDIRLAKARVFAARSLLEDNGPGQGATFDADREVFSPLNALAARDQSGLPIEMHQFAIRHEEHRSTAQELVETILRTAGYSKSTFGEDEDGGAKTATEVTAKQKRSLMTRDRKIRVWRPELAAITSKLLAVDRALFNGPGSSNPVRVEFPDGVQDSPLELAQTAQALRVAEAASTETLVRLVHPDWDDEDVKAEVARIGTERPGALPDPVDPTLVDGATGPVA